MTTKCSEFVSQVHTALQGKANVSEDLYCWGDVLVMFV
jgi:hypothetical protein